MKRLTKMINTIDENTNIQAAIDKLANYEDLEAQGRLAKLVTEAYYRDENDRIVCGEILSITYKHLLVEEGPDFEVLYTIDKGNGFSFTGKLGKEVFNTREEVLVNLFNL